MYPSLYFIPTMSEFFRLCGNFSDNVPFPRRNFSHYVGFFPTMSEFFPIPILYAGKNPLLVDGMDPRSIWCKKTLWVAVKIFLSLLRKSSVICKAISRKSAETFSFFLQCSRAAVLQAIVNSSFWYNVFVLHNDMMEITNGELPNTLCFVEQSNDIAWKLNSYWI